MTPDMDLHAAAHAGDVARLEELLAQGADVNARDARGFTPLALAALKSKVKAVRVLLAAGADVFARDGHGKTLLFYLAQVRSARIREMLRETGEQKAAARSDITLLAAAEDGLTEKVKSLLQSGAAPDPDAFLIAAKLGHFAIAAALVEAGVDVNASRGGWKPIHLAAGSGSGELVRMLVAAGADPDEPTAAQGNPLRPLHIAVTFDKPDCVAALIASGADLEATVPIYKMRGLVDTKPSEMASSRAVREIFAGIAPQPEDAAFAERARMREAAATPEFSRAIEIVADATGHKPAPWKRAKGVFVVYAKSAVKLEALRAEIARFGFQLMTGLENEHGVSPWMLFPTANPFAVLSACGTNGDNYGFGTREVVRELMSLAGRYPFIVTTCGYDFVGGHFDPPLSAGEAAPVTALLAKLCPDVGGPADQQEVARRISTTGEFFLWWD